MTINRRDFIKSSGATAAAFSLAGLTALPVRQARAATLDYVLTAEQATKSLIDGAQVPVWQLSAAGGGPGVLSSGVVVSENDLINVTLNNNLDRPINFAIPGVLTGQPPCPPGGSQAYRFSAPPAGSYFYTDELNGPLSQAMGLIGPLVVLPLNNPNQLYPGGPTFDQQYTLVLQELDTRINSAVALGNAVDLTSYAANYFFANGLSYPDTRNNVDTDIAMSVGQDVAIRLINASLSFNCMHFHGYHVNVVTRNRLPETRVIEKDTVLVQTGECVDVILPVSQAGTYPLHNHYLPAVTANGVYGNGALLLLRAV